MLQVVRLSQPHTGMTRIACSHPCIVDDGKLIRTGAVWNMSVGGLYLALNVSPRVGERLSVAFYLPGEAVAVKAAATVVWRNRPSASPGAGESAASLPPGCGLQFLTLNSDDRRRIETRVKSTISRARIPAAQ